jgi:hypothetical protein
LLTLYCQGIAQEGPFTTPAQAIEKEKDVLEQMLWLRGPSGSILTADPLIQSDLDIQIHKQHMRRFWYFVALLICLSLYVSALAVVFMSIGPWLNPSPPTSGVCSQWLSRLHVSGTDCSRIPPVPRT